ncbi:MAG: 16S rRNA (guanine(966)-N(2))-methyltransferase RsmD [Planctomycetes bacterium]|nr:16S rRNA (guanine(966)-N(2))-methyltransferase RsmD [Planctomycetota bacterium]
MRVIAGSARGRQLGVPREGKARPLLEMARGAIFNILGEKVREAAVLDLYAGSGAIGIEALSRGAESCAFVEADPNCARELKNNLIKCGFAQSAKVLEMNVIRALPQLAGSFDLIFLDPPYQDAETWENNRDAGVIVEQTCNLLAKTGTIIFRLEKTAPPPPTWGELPLRDQREYGRSRICFYSAAETKED